MSSYNDPDAPYPMGDQARMFDGAGAIVKHLIGIVFRDQIHPIDTVIVVLISNPNNITVSDLIHVTDTINAQKILSDGDAISIKEAITFNITRHISLVDNLPILQNLSMYKQTSGSGNSGSVYTDPTIIAYEGTLTPPGSVTFTCNATSAIPEAISTTITIRKPIFGDTNSFEQFRVQRNLFGGDLEIYQDRIWPIYEILQMGWEYLSKDDADNLFAFLNITEGQKITFNDQFGETFDGYIITPSDKVIQPKVKGYSASFSFQRHFDPNSIDVGDV